MSRSIIISKTGIINGRGSMPFKWVSGLTDAERKHVRNGGTVLVEDAEATHYTQCGWKQVTYYNGKYGHREATQEQIARINYGPAPAGLMRNPGHKPRNHTNRGGIMKITERQLLDRYDGVCNCGALTSIVNSVQIWWDYRVEREDCNPVTTRDNASHISLSNDRIGNINLDDSCNDHPAIAKIAEDEAKLYGDQI